MRRAGIQSWRGVVVLVLGLASRPLAAAPVPARELRTILDCRWTKGEQCEWTRKALADAVKAERLRVVDRVEHLEPLENPLCTSGCAAVPDGDGQPRPTLWVVPAHFVTDAVHLAFTLPDGTVRSVLYLDDQAFDRYRRMAPSRDGAVMDLIKVTTGLWMVDLVTRPRDGPSLDDGVTWPVKQRVWRGALRSVVQHGFSSRPPLLGRRTARDGRWQVQLTSVEVTPVMAPLWTEVAVAAVGRRLEDVLQVFEHHPRTLGSHTITVAFENASYGSGTRGFSKVVDAPAALTEQGPAFQLRCAVEGAHLMPRSADLAVRATLELSPRPRRSKTR